LTQITGIREAEKNMTIQAGRKVSSPERKRIICQDEVSYDRSRQEEDVREKKKVKMTRKE